MIKAIFDGFLIDPRKLLVGGFLLCLVTMAAHVMDCEFRTADYFSCCCVWASCCPSSPSARSTR